jgi:Photosystem II complex subunit Ycf12
MDFQVIFQLVCLALIVVSGPIVVFLLVARGGDL